MVTVPHAVFESQVAVSCPSGVIVRLNGSATAQCPGVTVPVHVPARALTPSIGAPGTACIEAHPAEKTMVAASSTEPNRVMSDLPCPPLGCTLQRRRLGSHRNAEDHPMTAHPLLLNA